MEKMQIGNRSSAVGRASLGLQHTVVKVFIPKFKFIRDMLDDPSFQQSLSVFHRFPAVWCQSNLNKPAHQIGAAEDASGCPGTTPVCQKNDSPKCSVTLVPALCICQQVKKNREETGQHDISRLGEIIIELENIIGQ